MKPLKIRQIFPTQIVKVFARACCLRSADGKSFYFVKPEKISNPNSETPSIYFLADYHFRLKFLGNRYIMLIVKLSAKIWVSMMAHIMLDMAQKQKRRSSQEKRGDAAEQILFLLKRARSQDRS